MANTYKNIVITPNTGSNTSDPKIVFSGANNTTNTDITLYVYPSSNGTLSYEGSSGQLFSITNDLTGVLFSVGDASGIPFIEVDANGRISMAQYTGNVYIGGNSTYGTTVTIAGNTFITLNGTSGITVTGEMQQWAHNIDGYAQIHLRNANTGRNASTDLVATADSGSDTTDYINLGINGSGYNVPSWNINNSRDGYLYTQSGNLAIGLANVGKVLSFFTGGTGITNERVRITDTYVNVNTSFWIGTINVGQTLGAGYAQANGAFITAAGAYSQANAAFLEAVGAFNNANSTLVTASAAYSQANGAFITASVAFDNANTTLVTAAAAFNAANGKLALTGGSLSGDLTVNKTSPSIWINRPDPTSRGVVYFNNANVARWALTGGNASEGNDFYINRFNATGVYVDTLFRINASTGQITSNGVSQFSGNIVIGQAQANAPFHIARPGGTSPNMLLEGDGEQTIRFYNTNANSAFLGKSSFKFANRFNSDWMYIFGIDLLTANTFSILGPGSVPVFHANTTPSGNAYANVSIGFANTTGSALKVNGQIESVTSGFKFPDGTIQSTALVGSTATDFKANTADKFVDTDTVWSAAQEVALTDAATISVDMSTFINANVVLGGNRTLGQPTNTKTGQSGCIRIIQDATGSRTLAYHADWKFAQQTAPILSTTANSTDLLFYHVLGVNKIFGSLINGVA